MAIVEGDGVVADAGVGRGVETRVEGDEGEYECEDEGDDGET